MNKNKIKTNAKRAAYQQKKEQEGRKVINWIFVVLVLLGLAYAIYSVLILG